jgi:hypothetical protein
VTSLQVVPRTVRQLQGRGDFNPPLAEALLAGWRKYFATRLDRLPYFGKSGAFAPGEFYFSAYLFWIQFFHEIHLLK